MGICFEFWTISILDGNIIIYFYFKIKHVFKSLIKIGNQLSRIAISVSIKHYCNHFSVIFNFV